MVKMVNLSQKSDIKHIILTFIFIIFIPNLLLAEARFQEDVFSQTSPEQNGMFGSSVQISGAYAIATSTGDPSNPQGQSAYFYLKNAEAWSSVSVAMPEDSQIFENFGYSCDIDGNHAVIGAYSKDNTGAVYVYSYDGTSWNNTLIISHSNLSVDDMFGFSVSLHSDNLIIGAPGDDEVSNNAGAVYCYRFSGNTWNFEDKITNPSAGTEFGYAVDNYNSNFVVSSLPALQQDSNYRIFVYNYNNNNWTMFLEIPEQTPDFGCSLAMTDSRLLVGACGDNPNGSQSGSVYYFEYNGTYWDEIEVFSPHIGSTDDYFGKSVDILNDIAVIGAPGSENSYNSTGYSCYYELNGNNWNLKRILSPENGSIGDFVGASVSISQDDIFVGCPGQDSQVENSGIILRYEIPEYSVDFHADFRRATAGDTIQFFSGAVGNVTEYQWDFDNDDVIDSYDENPQYVYTDQGNYDVKLSVRDEFEIRTMIKEDYIKIRSLWDNEHKLTDNNSLDDYEFGHDIAFDNNNAIVHSIDNSGILPVNKITFLTKNNGTWNQIQSIVIDSSSAGPVDIDINGDYAILGSAYDNNHGYCYVFHNDGSTWAMIQSLKPFDNAEFARCGTSVSLSDSLLVCGAEEGRVYVWKIDSGQWIPDQTIEPSDGLIGQGFGESVDIHNGKIFVGAPYKTNSGLSNAGLIYLYEADSTGWTETQIISPMEPQTNDFFGSDMNLYGDYMIIGKFRQDIHSGTDGAAFVFYNNAGVWSEQQKIFPDLVSAGSMFGRNVDINGEYAIIGASYDSEFSENSGAAFLYKRNGYSWEFYSKLNPEEICAKARFGHRVMFNDDEVMISAPFDSENGTKAGAVYFYPYEQIPVKNIEEELTYSVINASNYPNPFNPRTTIRFSLAKQQNVNVAIYNLKGQKVKTLLNENLSTGTHEVVWTGEDKSGRLVGSGVYFYRIAPQSGNAVVKKCIMLK